MKILIEISPANYDTMLSKISMDSPAYAVLKNGVKVRRSAPGIPSEIINIACEPPEATMLLDVARKFCPAAASEIEDGIARARPLPD
jgi:hypothetical protein